ncbi:hypothetical protein J31TS4_05770 [Paenibacillus sp. J31TS4]|uniref:hypothetical protein n=1 Tax=Paenibacillus sp. J31TS4 TaxID=2807195 RepID=UPI001B0B8198|nr:hypothetical protein [Paenibacillus sp. J31TS4]GIP37297.1 hypothetical protein J31TS4_05770 [Paenibacillus sp. J31TS4]
MKWIWKRDGSVSVTILLLVVPLFLFHAVLIDYARIRIADRETEYAVRAAGRSVLSSYDRKLQPYGLFGLAGDEALRKERFNEVFAYQLASPAGSGFSYLDLRAEPDDRSNQALYSLGNPIVFQRQVLEEMKYRAPLSYAESIIGLFQKTGMSEELGAGAAHFENAERLEALLEKLDKELDETWDEAMAYMELASSLHARYSSLLSELNSLSERIGFHTADSVRKLMEELDRAIRLLQDNVASQQESVRNMHNSMNNADEEQQESLTQAIESVEQSIAEAEASLNELFERKQSLEQLLTDIAAYVALVTQASAGWASDVHSLQQANSRLAERIEQARLANERLRAARQELMEQSNQAGADYWKSVPVYDMEFFSSYKTDAGKVAAMLQAMKDRWEATSRFSGEPYEELMVSVQTYGRQIAEFRQTRESEEHQRGERTQKVRQAKSEQKAKLERILSEVRKVTGECGEGDRPFYETLGTTRQKGSLAAKYAGLRTDQEAIEGVDVDPLAPKDAETGVKGAVSILKAIPGLLLGLRDKAYTAEYALTKFNYRTMRVEEEKGGKPAARTLSAPLTHPLAGQEAEYVLYGQTSCTANLTSAYGEMYLLFLAVRTVENMMEPDKQALRLGSPMLAFLTAAAEGALEAWTNMKTLLDGDRTALFLRLPQLTVSYPDLLRIFMLLHGREAGMTARMQALIELNTEVPLTDRLTYLQSTATASIRLWFLPGLFRLAGEEGQVRQGRWHITKTEVTSY